jgi:hypothetical protein
VAVSVAVQDPNAAVATGTAGPVITHPAGPSQAGTGGPSAAIASPPSTLASSTASQATVRLLAFGAILAGALLLLGAAYRVWRLRRT